MDNSTSTTECFRQIQNLILTGAILPGEKIKGEYLKQQLNLSLSPIREALSKLTATGLVDFKDKIGFSVATLNTAKVTDIFKTHAKLECLLLHESIEHGTDKWEADIMAALYMLSKVEIEGKKIAHSKWAPYNEDFHNILVAGCQLSGLIQARDGWLQQKNWCITLAHKGHEDKAITVNHAPHAALANLAVSRQSNLACKQLYEHLLISLDTIVMLLDRQGILRKL